MRNEKMPMDDGGAVGTGSYGTPVRFVVARRQPVLVCSDVMMMLCGVSSFVVSGLLSNRLIRIIHPGMD
jgi:hypothetical protein